MIISPGSRVLGEYRDKAYAYDIIGGTLGAVAPHAATQRFGLDIPLGDRFVLELVYLEVIRSAAATAAGVATAQLRIGETGYSLFIYGRSVLTSNTVGASERLVIPCSVLLLPGTTIALWTSDTSAGGTCDYIITAWGVHFRR